MNQNTLYKSQICEKSDNISNPCSVTEEKKQLKATVFFSVQCNRQGWISSWRRESHKYGVNFRKDFYDHILPNKFLYKNN